MIDPKLIDAHPLTQQALVYLTQLPEARQKLVAMVGEPLPAMPACLMLALTQTPEAWMPLIEVKVIPRTPAVIMSLLVDDPNTLDQEIRETQRGQEWPALKEHLDILAQSLKSAARAGGAAGAEAAAKALAENLANELRSTYPSWFSTNWAV